MSAQLPHFGDYKSDIVTSADLYPSDREDPDLIWDIIDGVVGENERRQFAARLLNNRDLRKRYLKALMLEVDLRAIFSHEHATGDAA